MSWKNPSKECKFINFSRNFGIFYISFILICTDISVSISVLSHETKSDSNFQQYYPYTWVRLSAVINVKMFFHLFYIIIWIAERMIIMIIEIFWCFLSCFMFCQKISWIINVTSLRVIGETSTSGNRFYAPSAMQVTTVK